MYFLNDILLWALRIVLPLTVWRLGRTRWLFPGFVLYLIVVSVSSWLQPEMVPIDVVVTLDILVMAAGLLTTVETIWRLFQYEPPRHRLASGFLLTLIGIMGGLIVAGVHGWAEGWELLESCRLMATASYMTVTGIGILYAIVEGVQTQYVVRRHGLLWMSLMGLSTMVSLWPKPTEESWYQLQVGYRAVMLAMLLWWPQTWRTKNVELGTR